MVAVMSKSAMTPSFNGRTATIEPGVRPIIFFASEPTASTVSERTSTATTEGSRMTIPLPFIYTRVFAVPKSIPISFENIDFPLSSVFQTVFRSNILNNLSLSYIMV